jgi:uncharacterized protein YjbI with pentapeptide repeats
MSENINEANHLRKRWKSTVNNNNFLSLDVQLTEFGLYDYRGAKIDLEYSDEIVEKKDFSFAEFQRSFLRPKIVSCRFENTIFKGNLGYMISDSLFIGVIFKFLLQGEWNNNTIRACKFNDVGLVGDFSFNSCNFESSDFVKWSCQGKVFKNCKFINCRFKNCAFANAFFYNCEFVDCSFKGFLGLSDATFEKCAVSRETFLSADDLVDNGAVYS